jgi:phenylpyruvate tautomerase PptA (4-oxalocrotonate tautomerase family)
MPLVKVEIIEGKTKEYKQAIFDAVHNALVETIKIPDIDRTQRIYELKKENFEIMEGRSENFTLIEIALFSGRSIEMKKALYLNIVEKLALSPRIDKEDVLILLHEESKENWGMRGGKIATEIDFGFKINV